MHMYMYVYVHYVYVYPGVYEAALSNSGSLYGWCEAPSTFQTSLSPLYQIPVNLLLAFTHFHLKSLFGLNRLQ